MNTTHDTNNLRNEEMLWTEVSNTIQDFGEGITEHMVKEFFKGNLNKDEAIFGFFSLVALKIANSYIPVNQDEILSEDTNPTPKQYKPRRTPRQKQRLFTLKDILTLKGN